MREIKFRGKRIDNGEWVYGYYCFNGYTDEQKHFIIPDYASAFYGIEVIPETVGQFTGLHDKNGKEIYEGDYCKLINASGFTGYGHVQCNDGCFDIVFKEPLFSGGVYRHRDYLKCWTINYAVEIIGNIHESELMEVHDDKR
jgi:uncharacterized phage protein (TIGR01671 family)